MQNIKWSQLNRIAAIPLRLFASVLFNLNWFGFAKDINKIKTVANQCQRWKASNNFIDILVVAEDRRFYGHCGVDVFGILRAIWIRIFCGSLQGASTIEQQLVRVVTGRYQVRFSRKVREMIIASYLKTFMSKPVIARLYLQIAYYGADMNGLHAACKKLGIKKEKASIVEAAEVVSRLKYPQPSRHSTSRMKKINQRVIYICQQYEASHMGSNARYNKRVNRTVQHSTFPNNVY